MKYFLIVHSVNEIEDDKGLAKAFAAFENSGWAQNDLETLFEKGEFCIEDFMAGWGVKIKTHVKLVKMSDSVNQGENEWH